LRVLLNGTRSCETKEFVDYRPSFIVLYAELRVTQRTVFQGAGGFGFASALAGPFADFALPDCDCDFYIPQYLVTDCGDQGDSHRDRICCLLRWKVVRVK